MLQPLINKMKGFLLLLFLVYNDVHSIRTLKRTSTCDKRLQKIGADEIPMLLADRMHLGVAGRKTVRFVDRADRPR